MTALLIALVVAALVCFIYLLGWEVGFQKGTEQPGYNEECSRIDELLDYEDDLHVDDQGD